jgi:uncharacterized membrane protein HdeD (DUF308 family)
MTASIPSAPAVPAIAPALRTLYFVRFALAIVWALALFATAGRAGVPFTVLVVLYPLIDAAAVLWQLRAGRGSDGSRIPEWINVVMSVAAAIALGIAASSSVAAALAVWGVWAIVSGITQLVTAILRRRAGGQVPLIVSGAISVFAGTGFLVQGLGGAGSAVGVGGYAILGGIFFLIAAIRLSLVLRTRY